MGFDSEDIVVLLFTVGVEPVHSEPETPGSNKVKFWFKASEVLAHERAITTATTLMVDYQRVIAAQAAFKRTIIYYKKNGSYGNR